MPRPHPEAPTQTKGGMSKKPEVVRIRLLGGFWVSVGGRSIGEDEWRLRKAANLIKLLALEPGHRMHREQLMDLLWPQLDAKAATNNLHRTLHFARRSLESDPASRHLRLQGDLLALCPDAPLWVDVESFEGVARAARRARDPAAYRAAIELYAGDLLPEDRYEEWAQERREELRQLYLTLLVELARLHEEREEFVPAIEALRRVVAAETTHEEAHVGLMRVYAMNGRLEEALRQHERLQEALSREFGTEPGMTSRHLYQEILAGRFPSTDPTPRDHPPAEELEGYGAARLFVDRARHRRTGFAPNPQNVGAIADVCRQLDGMPLAIELAAARVGVLSVEQISERLEDSLKLLTGGGRATDLRHQTLRGTLDWSYKLLDESERRLLGQLSVFAGGWTLEAAEVVGSGSCIELEEVSALIFRLVDKSLVLAQTSGDTGVRYRLLEPVRQYGGEKLDESGEAPETRRRHAGFFLGFVEQAEPKLTGAQQATWLDRLEIEYGNLRAALGWSLEEGGDPEVGLRLAGALWRFCYTRGYYGEGREWLEATLARSDNSPANLRAKALTGAGVLAFLQCEYERATVLLEESLTLYRDLGDEMGIASALQTLGSIARERGHYARAVAFHEESLALQRAVGNEEGIARALDGLGFAAWLQEDHERAWTLCTEALTLYRGLEDAEGIAWSLVNLGAVAQYRGDLGRAEALLKESLTLSWEAGYREGVGWSLNELGLVAYRRGELGRGVAKGEPGGAPRPGDRWRIASVLEGLGEAARAQGEFERAVRLFGAAEVLREAIGTPAPLCERPDRESNVAAARAGLDDAAWEAAWAEGQAMSLGEAVEYALVERSGAAPREAPAEARPAVLARRQWEIAALIARGLTSREIAAELTLSEHTVNTHVARILSKLNLRSRTQVVAWSGGGT
jgi:predicted ATPase/DNA-binding CsgD family transcriptional regulator